MFELWTRKSQIDTLVKMTAMLDDMLIMLNAFPHWRGFMVDPAFKRDEIFNMRSLVTETRLNLSDGAWPAVSRSGVIKAHATIVRAWADLYTVTETRRVAENRLSV